MNTSLLAMDEQSLAQAAALIQAGEVVAFPTETVYGLGANALDEKAVEKIFLAKGRPQDNPLIVHVADIDEVAPLVAEISDAARCAMQFWPGPLTLVMKKSPLIPAAVTAGLDTVGIRLPGSEAARRLIRACGVPIAAPSANRSGRPSPTTAADVAEDMRGRIPLILDGGACEVGLESTVLDVTGEIPVVLRPGGVTPEMLRTVLGEVRVHESALMPLKKGEAAASPGMKYRHYAPGVPVYLAEGELAQRHMRKAALKLKKRGYSAVLLTQSQGWSDLDAQVIALGDPEHPEQAAAALFSALRECERRGADVVLAQGMDASGGMGLAVMNRLIRSAGFTKLYEKNILLVCTGNTCRSPMAAVLLENELANPGAMMYEVTSAGLNAFTGDEASPGALRAMAQRGLDLSAHRARRLSFAMLEQASLIICMTAAHRDAIRRSYPEGADKTLTLGEFAGLGGDVVDPFGGDAAVYERCAAQLARLCARAAQRLTHHQDNI